MHRLGVCSWSLRAASPRDLVEKIAATGVRATQLALEPLRSGSWSDAETRAALQGAGITILSAMMETVGEDYATLETIRTTGGLRPSEHWKANLARAQRCAVLAREFGTKLVTFHAGFLPHDTRDPERKVLVGRLREVARAFAGEGIAIALETGQEDAATLLPVLEELAEERVGVNFDPANMILYGMGEPVAALEQLGRFVRQVHVKDALPSAVKGTWGSEVPVGTGAVAWERFFATLGAQQPSVDLAIEREAGEQRVADVRTARALVQRLLGARCAS